MEDVACISIRMNESYLAKNTEKNKYTTIVNDKHSKSHSIYFNDKLLTIDGNRKTLKLTD